MNRENLNAFRNTLFVKQGGSCFEVCDYEAMYDDLIKFIDRNFVARTKVTEYFSNFDETLSGMLKELEENKNTIKELKEIVSNHKEI